MLHRVRTAFLSVLALSFFVESVVLGYKVEAQTVGLVKGSSPAVYYATANGDRYAFPNEKTYTTWFADFSRVQTISDQALAQMPLRANVTYRPGVRLMKITTDPKVYAVSQGAVLRWVTTESIAQTLYGQNWARTVDDVPDTFFINYTIGQPILNASAYSPSREQTNTTSIEVDKGLAGVPPTPLPTPPPTAGYPGMLRTVHVNNVSALREATNTARPGDVIRISAGSYRLSQQWWIEAKGTVDHPIYIVADGARGSANFTGADDEGVNVGGQAAYLVFEGLEVHDTNGNVMHVQDGAHHITLRDLNLHDAGADGDVLKINQANHITIEGCDLARPGRRPAGNEAYWQEAIDLVDVDDAVIRRNFIHDVGNMAGYVKGGSKRALIEDNVITDQRSGPDGNPIWGIGGSTDTELFQGEVYEAIDTVFRHNVIAHTSYGGLALMDAKNSLIERNLFLNVSLVEIQSRAGNAPRASTDGVTIHQNIFTDTTGHLATICEHLNNGLSGVQASENIYWNAGSPLPSESGCGFSPGREMGAQIRNPNQNDVHPTTYEQAMTLLSF